VDQFRFEARQENFRVGLQNTAAIPKFLVRDDRFRHVAVAPLAAVLIVTGLFLARELLAETRER
jgi:hypothetical protein